MPSERRRNRLCRSQQAIHGPRLSVVHPASTATKPIGIVTWHARRYHLLLNSFRLEWHYDPGHHPHAERDREDPNPEVPDPEVDSVSGSEMQPFQQGDVGWGADGKRRQQDVPADHPGELDSRKKERIGRHRNIAPLQSANVSQAGHLLGFWAYMATSSARDGCRSVGSDGSRRGNSSVTFRSRRPLAGASDALRLDAAKICNPAKRTSIGRRYRVVASESNAAGAQRPHQSIRDAL